MQYLEFVKHVEQRAQIQTREQGEAVVKAVIETLADRLSDDEPRNLAAQLPEPIKGYLNTPGVADVSVKYSVADFIAKVGERAGVDAAQAERSVRAVWSVLNEAVSPGEIHDVRVRFPPEYVQLFGDINQREISA